MTNLERITWLIGGFDCWRDHRWTLATGSRNSTNYSGRCLATRHFGSVCSSRVEAKHGDWRDRILRGRAGQVHTNELIPFALRCHRPI